MVSPTQQNPISDLRVVTSTNGSWLWENTLTYSRVTPVHRFDVLAGITVQSAFSDSLGGTRTNIVGDDPNAFLCGARR